MRRPELPEVFLGVDAVRDGALTAMELRGPRVRRLFRGVYCPSVVRDSHELRCRAAALTGEGTLVLTGRSAAVVRGVPLASTSDPVEVIALPGHRVNRRPGLQVRRVAIDPSDHEPWDRIAIARPERMTFDVLATGALVRAVADADRILGAGMTSRTGMERYLDGRRDHGVVRAREALALTDPRAESPKESELRVRLCLAGLTPTPQVEIHVDGRFVARVDLGFEEERVAVEYDGRWHGEKFALARDRDRQNRLRAAGWEIVFVTAEMLVDPVAVVDLVDGALRRARRRH
ncbi:endonuclease domain-containing protein [Rhodococcus sp. TAF43]|uniref:endonuclease domain-containing protein n=1 Tax=unclassified Rhodococcus (in: high G+C Gram-positive bacteria) TaxID=192944 RepID=UPI001583EA65|nr:hypothetical protein [Rhodococcus sp. W8901]QKT13037.1 hypothetical protein HUN07_22035 [Rhodococcus sp. W8901]